jgi:predicted ferric reductase
MAVLSLTSILYVRRAFYETFLKLHLSLNVTLLAFLWLQVGQPSFDFNTICLIITTGIWCLEKTIWLSRTIFSQCQNSSELTIVPNVEGLKDSDATLVQISLKRPWKITYGQYVFLTIASIPHTVIGRLQAHPYMIAWSDQDEAGLSRSLTLLIAHRTGFSRRIGLCRNGAQIRLDGPYGSARTLEDFDKIFFVASGVGIAAHLLAIRHLLLAHAKQTSRVRRISFLWFLETEGKLANAFTRNNPQLM